MRSSKMSLSQWNSIFIFLIDCIHRLPSYLSQQTHIEIGQLVPWIWAVEGLQKQQTKKLSALFGSILKSVSASSDCIHIILEELV